VIPEPRAPVDSRYVSAYTALPPASQNRKARLRIPCTRRRSVCGRALLHPAGQFSAAGLERAAGSSLRCSPAGGLTDRAQAALSEMGRQAVQHTGRST
jgi:hypothetical protein